MAGLPTTFGMPEPAPNPTTFSTPKFESSASSLAPPAFEPPVVNNAKDFSAAFEQQQNQPVISGLSGHIASFWSKASDAKQTVETEMLEAIYARRGEYTADRLQKIASSRQPAIYMMLASAKMRQVESLLRDVLLGMGGDKAWTLKPGADADIPPAIVESIAKGLTEEVQAALQMGIYPTKEQIRQRLREVKSQIQKSIKEEAVIRCERMELKMEDQLVEGGHLTAMDQFIADLATFKTAFVKGPVIRNKPQLSWDQTGELMVETTLTLNWERVDPFNMYPAPWARNISEGPLIEKHKLTREELNQLIGVEGYSEPAIRKVLEDYGSSGLNNWLSIDSQKLTAEGKDQLSNTTDTGLIDALQYWGSASGQMLLDWGMDKAAVPDPAKEYQIEAWKIGSYVIKAVLNSDPLARRPYYTYSFQQVPGNVWGNSPYDLMKDCQDMCNAAARALAANLGIASGPQVAIISNRLPPGEDVTEMYPWKIWQFETDPMGSTAAPITFFQPKSNASELMTVYSQFSQLADEYTGIPKYMAGFNEGAGGAGRTASGMSMMIGNASKVIKQVVGGIDINVTTPLLERLYYYNMRYSDDPDLKGDVRPVARGALSMSVKEAAQVRRNEFLAATANPIDMQIIGLEGRGEVLRESVKGLDMNVDRVVPSNQVLKEKAMMLQIQQAQQQQAEMQGGTPSNGSGATNNQQMLMNGAPVTDNFAPTPA